MLLGRFGAEDHWIWWDSSGIPQVFLIYSRFTPLLILCSVNSPPLNALPVPLLRQVCKTLLGVSFPCMFSRLFFGACFFAFGLRLGVLWEPFGRLLVTFWRFVGFGWIALTLERKHTWRGLGGPWSALVRLLLQVLILGCVFEWSYWIFHDFGGHFWHPLAPFGTLFGVN